MSTTRPYWSARHGKGPTVTPLTREQVTTLFVSLIDELERKGSFQEAFGYECIDEGRVPGAFGPAISDRILMSLGHEDVWPPTATRVRVWSDDQLFDVVEFLFDHVSTGLDLADHGSG